MSKPTCCGRPIRVNNRINRKSGQRIEAICSVRGKTQTVKVEGGK